MRGAYAPLAAPFVIFIWIWHNACDPVEQAVFPWARAAYEFIQVLLQRSGRTTLAAPFDP